jgi:hypothetical protein
MYIGKEYTGTNCQTKGDNCQTKGNTNLLGFLPKIYNKKMFLIVSRNAVPGNHYRKITKNYKKSYVCLTCFMRFSTASCGMLVAVVWFMAPSITEVCTSRSSNSFSNLSIRLEIFSRFIDFIAADMPCSSRLHY